MRALAMTVLLTGCTQVFGLDKTELEQLPMPDATPAPSCPAFAGTPSFGIELHQVDVATCSSYSVDEAQSTAAALCLDDTGATHVYVGAVGEPLALADLVPAYATVFSVRMAPEGDMFLLTVAEPMASQAQTWEYTRVGPQWIAGAKPTALQGFAPQFNTPSTPSRGPSRRVVIMNKDASFLDTVAEWQRDASGQWTTVRETPPSAFGTNLIAMPQLSADGLRLVFVAAPTPPIPGFYSGVFFADRASLDDAFGAPRVIATVPDSVEWPQLSSDCGRIYFEALARVWFLTEY